jgi:hypothetical protein
MPYVLGLSDHADGSGAIQSLATFTTNPAGSAIVNAVGPLCQIVSDAKNDVRRYLVIAPGDPANLGPAIQTQQ